jgi:NADH-quinone oxidoreductase subunit J
MAATLAGALLAVSLSNVLHAIFGLALALLGVARIFLVLGSPFVAAMEVLIYVGGISVAMIFAVMLSSVVARDRREGWGRRLLAVTAAGLFFAGAAAVLTQTDFAVRALAPGAGAGSVARIGQGLLDEYNVVFETLSLVLLLAIIGAIVISRRDADADAAPRHAGDGDATGGAGAEQARP